MRRLITAAIGAWAVTALLALATPAQNAKRQMGAERALTSPQALMKSWNEIGRKLIAIAEDFPEDKYDFRPTPAQRSFAEQLLHVAGSNDLFSDVAKGQKAVDDESPAHYTNKAAVVAYLKKSFEKGAAVIRERGESRMSETVLDSESCQHMPLLALAWELVEHSGEHYGQLVVYYRVTGLVPPESRPNREGPMSSNPSDAAAAAIAKAIGEFKDAYNQGDLEKTMAVFSDDLVYIGAGRPTRSGKDALDSWRASLQDTFARYDRVLDIVSEEIRVSGDMGIERGYVNVVLTPKGGGEPLTETHRFLDVWEKRNGMWKLVVGINNK